MRTCTSCSVEYEDYGQRASICRPCKREYDRQYHKNRSQELKVRKVELQKIRRIENRQFIFNFLSSNPCEVCGESDPIVLEFDHIDQSEKYKAVSVMVEHSLDRIKEEIAKCRVLCANCHRRHTASQLNWYKDITV